MTDGKKNQILLDLKNVSFGYPERSVLQDVSLELPAGAFWGLLGPNGSGKTTLLRLMGGILRPNDGEIRLQNRPLREFPSRERAKVIAMVPQDFDVAFPFSALEVVLMGRWPYLKPLAWESGEDLRVAREAMEATDCLPFAKRPITELSGGEKERVLIARALAQNPQILLLDEPITHLDLKHQLQIHELLLKLNRERGIALVVVLHDLNFASLACERILLLKEGKLIKSGGAEEVMTAETLREVFGVEVLLDRHPKTGRPFYLPRL